eukprot:363897-Chlamydomonas_euryale.AAC.23
MDPSAVPQLAVQPDICWPHPSAGYAMLPSYRRCAMSPCGFNLHRSASLCTHLAIRRHPHQIESHGAGHLRELRRSCEAIELELVAPWLASQMRPRKGASLAPRIVTAGWRPYS